MIDSQTGTIFTEKKKETGPIQTKEAHKNQKQYQTEPAVASPDQGGCFSYLSEKKKKKKTCLFHQFSL